MIAPKTTLNNLVFNYQVSCAAMAPKALNLSRLPQESSTLRWCSFKFSATFVKEPIWYSWSPQLIKNELKNGLNNLCLFSFIIMQQGVVLTRPLYYCILYLFGVFIACLAWPEDLNLLALAHFIHHHFKCMSAFLKNMVTIWCCWQHLVQLKKTHSLTLVIEVLFCCMSNMFSDLITYSWKRFVAFNRSSAGASSNTS